MLIFANICFFLYSKDEAKFKEDLLNIARTTLSSKILSQHKEHFANLAVEAVLRLKGSGSLSAIQIIKKSGGRLEDSFLDEGKSVHFSSNFPVMLLCFLYGACLIFLSYLWFV